MTLSFFELLQQPKPKLPRRRAGLNQNCPECRQRLNDLEFVWDPFTEDWEEGFSKLLQFKEVHGHCRVPNRFKLDGFNLGTWVGTQRSTKDSLSHERRQRLDDLGFVWDARKGKT